MNALMCYEMEQFQSGCKRIAIISDAGSVGIIASCLQSRSQ